MSCQGYFFVIGKGFVTVDLGFLVLRPVLRFTPVRSSGNPEVLDAVQVSLGSSNLPLDQSDIICSGVTRSHSVSPRDFSPCQPVPFLGFSSSSEV